MKVKLRMRRRMYKAIKRRVLVYLVGETLLLTGVIHFVSPAKNMNCERAVVRSDVARCAESIQRNKESIITQAQNAITSYYLERKSIATEMVSSVTEFVKCVYREKIEEQESVKLMELKRDTRVYTKSIQLSTDAEHVETFNQYFEMYDEKTLSEGSIERVVDIGKMRSSAGVGDSWVSFEGFNDRVPNKYATTKQDGALIVDEMNLKYQTYRGRYMVAVGPAIMMDNYSGQYVTASMMSYGSYIDVVVENSKGETLYIPCVVADCKMHTYPNGFYQTGKALLHNGSIDNVPWSKDYSSIEFTTTSKNPDGTAKSLGLCSEYKLKKVIVYSLDASK